MEEEFLDNKEKKQYELRLEAGTARLEYIRAKDDKIYLTHTEVPKKLEGKGIGSKIVKYALDDIRSSGLTLIPLCPFVALYLKRHPEYMDLVMKNVRIA
jgi:predicted GNAT family acetyltransferase